MTEHALGNGSSALTSVMVPEGASQNDVSLPPALVELFSNPDFDMDFPYLVHVQEVHDIIFICDLQSSAHPKVCEFLTRYPHRPEQPPDLNAMILAYREICRTVCSWQAA